MLLCLNTQKALSTQIIPAGSTKPHCWDGPWAQCGPCPSCGAHTRGSAAQAPRNPRSEAGEQQLPTAAHTAPGTPRVWAWRCGSTQGRRDTGTGHRDTRTRLVRPHPPRALTRARTAGGALPPTGTRGAGARGGDARGGRGRGGAGEKGKRRGGAFRDFQAARAGSLAALAGRGLVRLGSARPAGKRGSQGAAGVTHTGTPQARTVTSATRTAGNAHTARSHTHVQPFCPVYGRDTHGKQPRSGDGRPAREARLLPRFPVCPELPAP